MKTPFYVLPLILGFSFAQAQAQVQAANQQWPVVGESPVVVLKSVSSPAQFLPVMNAVNNSVAYATSTTLIKNGSGTKAPQALQQQGLLEQAFRHLSLLDLYFSYSVATKQVENVSAKLDILPYTQELNTKLKPIELPAFENSTGVMIQPLVQAAKSIVRLNSGQADYVTMARNAQFAGLTKRFPNVKAYYGSDVIGKMRWLANSYLPVATNMTFTTQGAVKAARTTMIFPAIGMLDLKRDVNPSSVNLNSMNLRPLDLSSRVPQNDPGYMPDIQTQVGKIHRIAFRAPAKLEKENEGREAALKSQRLVGRAMRVSFTKNFATPDVLHADVTFGYLPRQTTDAFSMDVDTVTGKDLANEMEFGLVAYGDVDLTASLVPNETIRRIANKYLKMMDFKIGFHKLSFQLSRSPYKVGERMVNFNYWGDIGWMMQNDPGFPISNLKLLPERSVFTFSIAIKPEYLQELRNLTFMQGLSNFEKLQRRDFVKNFCSMSEIYAKEAVGLNDIGNIVNFFSRRGMEGGCEVKATSLADFKTKLFSRWLNGMIMKEVDKGIASSVEGQVAKAAREIDPMVHKVSAQVVDSLQKARTEVLSRVTELK